MAETDPGCTRYLLGRNVPDGWNGTKVRYLKISYDPPTGPTPNGIRLRYSHKYDSQVGEGLGQVLAKVFTGTIPLALAVPVNPLDFVVDFEGYVVFELDEDITWQFRIGGAAVTLKQEKSKRYFDLRHYFSEDDVSGPDGPIWPGYRVAVFAVSTLGNAQRDGFNLHVQLLHPNMQNPDELVEIIIDPDIKNKGGSGLVAQGGGAPS